MIKIIDDFFDDPDSVVSLSETMEFSLKNPQWPGVRTQDLRKHAPNVKDMFVKHICDNYPRLNPFELNRDFRSGFQKITSFSKDQYDLKNKGWAHRDTNTQGAGIIYLNKNPEPDTGTVFYKGTQDKSLYKESPGMEEFRPSQSTPVSNFFLAGSYTRQDYIDSMEGATMSGRLAASAILEKPITLEKVSSVS